MIDEDQKIRIFDGIEAFLDGLSVEDAVEILTIQMAVVIAQGSDDLAYAKDFLDDVHQDVLAYLENVDFDAIDEDEDEVAGEEPVSPTRN